MIERIGEIVRTVRARAGLSLAELARQGNVPLEVLEALEQGKVGISTTQLDDVAAALFLDPPALLGGSERPRRLPSVFLRHSPMQDFDERDGEVLDLAMEQGRHLVHLRSILGEPPLALQADTFTPRAAAADRPEAPAQDGYRLARTVRQWLGYPTEPLDDLGSLIEQRFGTAVLVRNLSSSRVTAAAVRADDAAAIVLGARDAERARNPMLARVHLAHELCHLLFDPAPGGIHIVIDLVADRRVYAAEQRARAFAAELLLPSAGLDVLLGPPGRVIERTAALDLVTRARGRFGTPHDIAANHLCNQRFVAAESREWLEAARSPLGPELPETSLPDEGAPSRLVAELTARAHRGGILTDGEARAVLGLDRLAPLPWDEVER